MHLDGFDTTAARLGLIIQRADAALADIRTRERLARRIERQMRQRAAGA